jgi:CheY-like chemotaxis protein
MHLLLEALLEKETFDLHFARNGAEGIAMAISIQSDVILLDVMMPKMNGNATHGMD